MRTARPHPSVSQYQWSDNTKNNYTVNLTFFTNCHNLQYENRILK